MPVSESRVLVVGTTRDYIEHICREAPGRALFLTDPSEFTVSKLPVGGKEMHLVTPLDDPAEVMGKLKEFIRPRGIRISGIACYDCESLLLAAEISGRLPSIQNDVADIPSFPSKEAVLNSRDKSRSKELWEASSVDCPRFKTVRGPEEAASFQRSLGAPVVIKPLSMSGSELTFRCDTAEGAASAYTAVSEGLKERHSAGSAGRDGLIDPKALLCEEYIEGPEYSCDFILEDGAVEIIRTARKYPSPGGPLGTALAYEVPPSSFPIPFDTLAKSLYEAADSLGLRRCMAMADFFERNGRPSFLEITPRPGGDCLPWLIKQCSGLDTIIAHLDFAEGAGFDIPPPKVWKHLVGLRIHADREGLLQGISIAEAIEDMILEAQWKRSVGDRIILPPIDYTSWYVGHVIFEPKPGVPVSDQVNLARESVSLYIK